MRPLPICRSGCKIEDLKLALANGLDPNTQWEEFDIEYSLRRGRHVLPTGRSPDQHSWANMNTPLHMAVYNKNWDSVSLLLEVGADINQLNVLGRTALHEAIRWKNWEAMQFLIDNGCDINAVTEERSLKDQELKRVGLGRLRPLHEAIGYGGIEYASILLDNDIDVTYTVDGWAFLDLALLRKQEYVMERLMSRGALVSQNVSMQGHNPNQQLAEQLLRYEKDEKDTPNAELHEYFVNVVLDAGVDKILGDSSIEPRERCRKAVDKFFPLLCDIAIGPPAVTTAKYCSYCTQFQNLLASGEGIPPMRHQPSREALRKSAGECVLCRLLEDALATGSPMTYGNPDYDHQQANHVTLTTLYRWFRSPLRVMCEDKTVELHKELLNEVIANSLHKLQDEPLQGTKSSGAFETARAWLETCSKHELCNKDISTGSLPDRVIEIDQESATLISGAKLRGKYCTLMNAQGDWPIPDSVHIENGPLDFLPAVHNDAIYVARRLGFRYIWIDAICITPDGQVSIRDVYYHSSLTISVDKALDISRGLFSPRKLHGTHPVPLSFPTSIARRGLLRPVARLRHFFMLPVQAQTNLRDPFPANASSLIGEYSSRRILHYSTGLLHWGCITLNGSESDPEGFSSTYRNLGSKLFQISEIKDVLHEVHQAKHPQSQPLTPNKLFQTWKLILSEYTRRSRSSNRVFGINSLSKQMAGTLGGEPFAGLWSGQYLLPSLLWYLEVPSRSRNPNYPSWTWASTFGQCHFSYYDEYVTSVATGARINASASDSFQSSVTGSVVLTSYTIKIPSHVRYWERVRRQPHHTIYEALEIHEGFRDLEYDIHNDDNTNGLEYTKDNHSTSYSDETLCVVIAKVGRVPNPEIGFPVYPQGRPESLLCLCLQPVDLEDVESTEDNVKTFQRVGYCDIWNSDQFWLEAKKDQTICIV